MSITPKRIAVIGSALGGGAGQVVDACGATPDRVVAIFDRDERAKEVLGVPVVGPSDVETVCAHYEKGEFDAVVIAIGGNLKERQRLFDELTAKGVPFTNVIDPTTQIRTGVRMGTGNVILGDCYFGPEVTLGDNCYIINGTAIQHDSVIGNHVFFSTEVALAGKITVGDRARFSTRSGVNAKLSVGADAHVAAGVTLTADLPAGHRAEPAEVRVVPIG